MIKNIIRSPFFHFLMIGAVLFLLYNAIGDNKLSSDEHKILITDEDMSRLVSGWESQYNKLPDSTELLSIANDYVRQEVYYREALKLNLDHNDEIVRKRLALKMQFLSNNLAKDTKPSDEQLKEYYHKNQQKYLSAYSYSFYQICFSPDKRKNALEDAEKVLETIKKEAPELAKNKGDITVFSFEYTSITAPSLTIQLGSAFTDQLPQLDSGKWVGPIVSSFGAHLVYLEKKVAPSKLSYEEVKDKVYFDYEADLLEQQNASTYKAMKKQYTIDFDLKDDTLRHKLNASINREG